LHVVAISKTNVENDGLSLWKQNSIILKDCTFSLKIQTETPQNHTLYVEFSLYVSNSCSWCVQLIFCVSKSYLFMWMGVWITLFRSKSHLWVSTWHFACTYHTFECVEITLLFVKVCQIHSLGSQNHNLLVEFMLLRVEIPLFLKDCTFLYIT
jgi:hypothetical protein